MISQRRKRLAFAPAASDVRFGDCVKCPSALALERRRRCDPSHAGVMPYGPAESWLPRLSATPHPPARRLRRLDLLALCCGDVKPFSPEHGLCQIKFFRWSHLRTDAACTARKARLSKAMATCLFESPPIVGLLEARGRGCLVRALVEIRRRRGRWHSYGVSRNSVPPRPRRNERPVRSWALSRLAPIGS